MKYEVYYFIAIIVGLLMVLTVLWSLLKGKANENRAILTTLSLLGFLLVSCPLWKQVVLKGPKWEVSLYREIAEEQTAKNAELIENLEQYAKDEDVAIELKKQRDELVALSEQIKHITSEVEDRPEAEKLAKKLSSVTSKAVELSKPSAPTGLRIVR